MPLGQFFSFFNDCDSERVPAVPGMLGQSAGGINPARPRTNDDGIIAAVGFSHVHSLPVTIIFLQYPAVEILSQLF